MFKKICVAVLTCSLILSLTACGGDGKKVKELEATVTAQNEQIAQLQAQVASGSVTEQSIASSLQTVEGKKVPEFKFVDDTIVFPNKLQLPNSQVDAVVTQVKLGSKYSVSPSNNWLVRCDGSQVSLTHPSKIWGKISAVTLTEPVKKIEDMQSILKQFFVGFPTTNITYKQIFMDGTLTGLCADAPIVVEDQNYHVVVGFNTKSSTGIEFLFTYADDGSGVQGELVYSLLRSCEAGQTKLAFE